MEMWKCACYFQAWPMAVPKGLMGLVPPGSQPAELSYISSLTPTYPPLLSLPIPPLTKTNYKYLNLKRHLINWQRYKTKTWCWNLRVSKSSAQLFLHPRLQGHEITDLGCASRGALKTVNEINRLFQSSWHEGSLVSILLAPTGSPRRGHAARAGKQPFPLDGSWNNVASLPHDLYDLKDRTCFPCMSENMKLD